MPKTRSYVQPLYYAGIGSRITDRHIMERMRQLAKRLASCGYFLRSGAADGADTAFEIGANCGGGGVELWLPWPDFKDRIGVGLFPSLQHFEIASTLHPVWHKLPRFAKYLHARNVGQILGNDCETPVQFVICWTADGCESEATRTKHTGGTGTAIVLAHRHKIPVFNLYNEDAIERLDEYLKTHLHYPSQWNDVYDENKRPQLPKNLIFVFGSNLAGRHGKGAALTALNRYEAVLGQGCGLQGQSYGIPTKDEYLKTLPLDAIKPHIKTFVEFTKQTESFFFYLTPIGCGLAGYQPKDIAPLFKGVEYCWIPDSWIPYIL